MSHSEEMTKSGRRRFLFESGLGIGGIALSSLLEEDLFAQIAKPTGCGDPLSPKLPHFTPKAHSIIYLFMAGAPSQLDLFDYKPKLTELDGQKVPEELIRGERFAFLRGVPQVLGSPYRFRKTGQSGVYVSELMPSLTQVVDDITFIHSMYTEEFNHVPAQMFINTGSPRMGRPCMGSWVSYGLGSEARELPGFIVLASGKASRCGTSCWSNGFLPSVYQGVQFHAQGDPVPFLASPPGMDDTLQRESLDALRKLNQKRLIDVGDPEIATRIASYEMAYRMQTSVPELMDISHEPKSIHEMYGTEPGKISFASNCLLARRLVERGVRFVQLYHGGWDHHGGNADENLVTNLPERCRQTDRPAAALIRDLKQRGLLDNTLVVWGGEFGRTPMLQGERSKTILGRDHHRRAFTIWMAGGGTRAGFSLGLTDELGYNIVEDPVHIHDLQATLLHLLGLDHTRLTYRFQGRDFRLTDIGGNVVTKVLA